MRHLLPGGPVFEAVPDPMPAAPAAAPAEPFGAEPDPEPFSVSQEDWERMEQTNGMILDGLNQIAEMTRPEPEGTQLPEDSLLSPADVEFITQMLEERLAPLQAGQQEWTQSQGMQLAQDVLADENLANGEFLFDGSKEKAIDLAEQLVSQAVARFGNTPQAGEAAIHEACRQVREWEQKVGEAYYERQMNQFKTLSGVRPTPPARVAAPAETHVTQPGGVGGELGVVRKYFGA